MKGELESVGQKLSEHRHLLIEVGLDGARRRSENIVTVGIGPSRSAGDRPRSEAVGGRNQRSQGETLGVEPIGTLHPDVSAQRIDRRRFDRRHFERVECRSRRLRE